MPPIIAPSKGGDEPPHSGKVYDSILVIMDRYTKMARYLPPRKDIKAEELTDVIMNKHVLRGASLPQSIVSNRGSVFNAKYWSSLCYMLNVKRHLSVAYHPQTDGQTERQNSTLEQYLRAYVNYLQDDWTRWLPMAEFAYNNSRHASTGMSPFRALMGFDPQMGDAVQKQSRGVLEKPAAKERAEELLDMRRVLQVELR